MVLQRRRVEHAVDDCGREERVRHSELFDHGEQIRWARRVHGDRGTSRAHDQLHDLSTRVGERRAGKVHGVGVPPRKNEGTNRVKRGHDVAGVAMREQHRLRVPGCAAGRLDRVDAVLVLSLEVRCWEEGLGRKIADPCVDCVACERDCFDPLEPCRERVNNGRGFLLIEDHIALALCQDVDELTLAGARADRQPDRI